MTVEAADLESVVVRRFYLTDSGGLLSFEARDGAPPPSGAGVELTEDDYRQRLAQWETDRDQRRQRARDAARAQADADVATLVSAGILEAVAQRIAGHPDAQYLAVPEPAGGD